MEKEKINDVIFDALFEQAVIDNFYDRYNSLPSSSELSKEYTFSDRHEKRMKALFARERRKERTQKFMLVSKKVAAVFLILVTMFFGALMLNPNVRATVVETIITWHREFVKFISPHVDTEGTSMVPTYVPEGFVEAFFEELNLSTLIIYINEDGESILFESNPAEGSLLIDSENAIYDITKINNITYHILHSSAGRENSIIWDSNGWRYFLRSDIDVETLLEMALSQEK